MPRVLPPGSATAPPGKLWCHAAAVSFWLLAIAASGLMRPALCAAGGTDSAPGPQRPGFENPAPQAGTPFRGASAIPAGRLPPTRASGTAVQDSGPGGTDAEAGPPAPLPALARASFAAGRPLVVMFSLRGCPWCEALRREHFTRLLADQQTLGITAIELDLMDARTFQDDPAPAPSPAQPDDGRGLAQAQAATPSPPQAGSARELGRRYRVRFAPTVLFLGPDGEIAQSLVGYGSPDFFGAYLEQRIEQARAAIRPR